MLFQDQRSAMNVKPRWSEVTRFVIILLPNFIDGEIPLSFATTGLMFLSQNVTAYSMLTYHAYFHVALCLLYSY